MIKNAMKLCVCRRSYIEKKILNQNIEQTSLSIHFAFGDFQNLFDIQGIQF